MAKFVVIALMLAIAVFGGLGILGTQTTARAAGHAFVPAETCAALPAGDHPANKPAGGLPGDHAPGAGLGDEECAAVN
ncbi:MAG: hypothetical protein IIB26_04740 [Chloroflexi bacterium]|nr:hypothetical protein [Chloroflexota bacterium]